MRLLVLREGQRESLPANALRSDEAVAISRARIAEVGFPTPLNDHAFTLHALNVIGHIPVSPELSVVIEPKAPIGNLFRLLEVVFDLRSFRLFTGSAELESIEDLFERLAQILAHHVLRRVRVGLYRSYLPRVETLQHVRGTVDTVRTALAVERGHVGVHCSYEDITEDNDDNGILIWTLRCVSRTGIRRANVRDDLGRAYRALSGAVAERAYSPEDCVARDYHRLNADYAVMHRICGVLLAGIGPNLALGPLRLLPFQLNPANLFERFVATWLGGHVGPRYKVHPRRKVPLDASEPIMLDVDIVVTLRSSGETYCVIDTKYKVQPQPSIADLNQIIVYATALGAKRAYLAYPFSLPSPLLARISGIEVRAVSFDLAEEPELAGSRFLEQIGIEPAALAANAETVT